MASLLDLVEALVRDPQAKAAYSADPGDFLGRHGFGALEPSDLEEALHQAADSFPPALAAQVTPGDGFDSLVHVDLQELGFDDELRPLDPMDDGPDDDLDDDWRGPNLGDDVEFDAPLSQHGGVQNRSLDADNEDADHGPDADGDGDGGVDGDDGGDGARGFFGAEATFDTAGAVDNGVDDTDRVVSPDRDATLDDDGDLTDDGVTVPDGLDDGEPDGLVDATDLGQDSHAAWGEDDPWFYTEREPALEEPDDLDDDIMDDVDDFHHDG